MLLLKRFYFLLKYYYGGIDLFPLGIAEYLLTEKVSNLI